MSRHDEPETCQVCHVVHCDGPAHLCNPYAARWPEGPTDAEVKRGLNQVMSKMATLIGEQAQRITALEARETAVNTRVMAVMKALGRISKSRAGYGAGNEFGDGLIQGHKNALDVAESVLGPSSELPEGAYASVLTDEVRTAALEAEVSTLTAEVERLTKVCNDQAAQLETNLHDKSTPEF